MIRRDSTCYMHHLPDSFSAIRETPSVRMSAYSRPLYSSIDRALLRSIKVAPPGEYRMPVRRPNPSTEEHQYASQITCIFTAYSPRCHGRPSSAGKQIHLARTVSDAQTLSTPASKGL